MSKYLNEVHIIGTLSFEPECRTVKDGLWLANFSLITKMGRGKTFLRIVAWAEVAEQMAEWRLQKDDWLEVWGKLKTSTWEKDGQKRHEMQLTAYEIKVLEGAGRSSPQEIPVDESGTVESVVQPDSSAPPPAEEEGLPF